MKKRNNWKKIGKWSLLGVCFLLGIVFLAGSPESVIQEILHFATANSVRTALGLLFLYAVKSATVFFPLILLQIAAGHLFAPLPALGINLLGIVITLTVPYWIGRAVGVDAVQKLTNRYPRFCELVGKQQENSFFLCFSLRVISCLPGDLVTMYLGATRTAFWKNMVGGVLGILPGMILATLMGGSIRDMRSPVFWLSAVLMILLTVLSVLLYSLYRRRLRKRNANGHPDSNPTK